jgi:predicted metal-dependent peptidase
LKEIKEFWGKARESAFGKSDISQDPVLVSDMNRQYGSGSADMHRTASKRISDVLSYREILRDFFHRAEEKYEDHELIDQMLYHYGLELYGDVPLVEPSEEGTRREIDTIVIAVDTSGSCFDDSLDQFLLETEQMLKDLCALGDIPKVVMLQCDAEITKEVVIHGEEELGRYCEMEDFTGGGGTDFRPVFERIEEMEKTGEKVGALFYFTDGCGAYPEKKRENSYFIMKPEVFDEMTGKPMISGFPEWVHPIMLRK